MSKLTKKQSKFLILILSFIMLSHLLSKALTIWENNNIEVINIETEKIHIERQKLIYNQCGDKGGTYNGKILKCN